MHHSLVRRSMYGRRRRLQKRQPCAADRSMDSSTMLLQRTTGKERGHPRCAACREGCRLGKSPQLPACRAVHALPPRLELQQARR
eukprot:363061-Chlamydomonas_euryale.AAC.5